MIFYLGTHQPHWLARLDVPLFVSRRRLAGRRSLPRARSRWALDSGGFTELSMHGEWHTNASLYAEEARRYRSEIGSLDWAAIQDWMCEPWIIQKTGLGVAEHQRRTCDSWDRLRDLAPDVPWAPVLQGWHSSDYLQHAEEYERRGTALNSLPVVGVGSVCRRQGTAEAARLIGSLARLGLRLHGFGIKTLAWRSGAAAHLASADSMAWSMEARRAPPLPGCAGHKNCANCATYALRWRERLLAPLPRSPQMELTW